jgi:hypothetical protein
MDCAGVAGAIDGVAGNGSAVTGAGVEAETRAVSRPGASTLRESWTARAPTAPTAATATGTAPAMTARRLSGGRVRRVLPVAAAGEIDVRGSNSRAFLRFSVN